MQSVTVTLLATLLPTCILVAILASLSLYLHFQLRRLFLESKNLGAENERLVAENERLVAENEGFREQLPTPLDESPAAVFLRQLRIDVEKGREVNLSDESDPDWEGDDHELYHAMVLWPHGMTSPTSMSYRPTPELANKQILQELGYQGASPGMFRQLLEEQDTRWAPIGNVINFVAHGWTSLDSDPEHTLFPFSSETHRDLATFFKAIEGIKFGPEFSIALQKFPTQLALEHGAVNEDNLKRVMRLLDELLRDVASYPLGERNREPNENGHVIHEPLLVKVRNGFRATVALKLRMLGSRQKFEYVWGETSDEFICIRPGLYSYAGKDGLPLDEPKVWTEPSNYSITKVKGRLEAIFIGSDKEIVKVASTEPEL